VRGVLTSNRDIAAVILEPTGSSFGQQPIGAAFAQELRRLTEQHGVLLILDEVVTGFRVSPGGAQAAFDVRPDLSSFAKIVAGGLPGAAVAGRSDILDRLDFAVSQRAGREKIQHPGTFNANPVSAAAGTAALTVIAETDACERASRMAALLRAALNEVLEQEGVGWAVYGAYSGFHTFLDPRQKTRPATFDPAALTLDDLRSQSKALVNRLRLALLVHGVDVNSRVGGFLSATHTTADVAHTADAFRSAVRMLRQEGEIS
jgi:glutamate-1-semialdehyde 2,1-aminomutase